ncbi:hypothetical protein JL720_5580 [Aureococcus anophagefferens]|nr:hypothetical protein JL720_5580 [Aureococcus anophagefferens]
MASWAKYSVLSSLVTSAVVYYAFATREQFYPTVVYLVTSKVCVLCLGNQAIVFTLLVGRISKQLFLGSLREIEVELLYENSRYAITEASPAALAQRRGTPKPRCLALTIFREELTTRVFALFTALLFAKVFHWLVHASTRASGRPRGSYVFAVDFVAEVLRFAFYVVFFTIVFTYYGVPLHIVRELWVSYVSLRRRLAAYKRYRALTANMDERFPSATDEELDACGRICIICRDGMDEGKKLPCGHIFHFGCLRLWLQQQQSCPTCRMDIPRRDAAPPAADDDDGDPVDVDEPWEDVVRATMRRLREDREAAPAARTRRPPRTSPSSRSRARPGRRPRGAGGADAPPPGAVIWTVTGADGAKIYARARRRRARAPRPARALTVADPAPDASPHWLKVGDGFIHNDPVVLAPYQDPAAAPPAEPAAPPRRRRQDARGACRPPPPPRSAARAPRTRRPRRPPRRPPPTPPPSPGARRDPEAARRRPARRRGAPRGRGRAPGGRLIDGSRAWFPAPSAH